MGEILGITISHNLRARQVFSFYFGEKGKGDLASTSDLVELLPRDVNRRAHIPSHLVLGAVNGARRVEKSPGGNNSTAWFHAHAPRGRLLVFVLMAISAQEAASCKPLPMFQCATSVYTNLQPPRWVLLKLGGYSSSYPTASQIPVPLERLQQGRS